MRGGDESSDIRPRGRAESTPFCMGTDEVTSLREPFPLRHRGVNRLYHSSMHRFAWAPKFMNIVDDRATGEEITVLQDIEEATGLPVTHNASANGILHLGRLQIYYADDLPTRYDVGGEKRKLNEELKGHFAYQIITTPHYIESYFQSWYNRNYTYKNYNIHVDLRIDLGPDRFERVSRAGAPKDGVILATTNLEQILAAVCIIDAKDEKSRQSALSECAYRSLGLWFGLDHYDQVTQENFWTAREKFVNESDDHLGVSHIPYKSDEKYVGESLASSERVCLASKYHGLGRLGEYRFLTREEYDAFEQN